jgi:hypothetical protein
MMKNNLMTLLSIIALTLFNLQVSAQALKVPAPSPLQKVTQNFALSEVTLEYCRPSAKGRTVFGDLVPYGKIWRTGANASTKITFGEDVKVDGKEVAAGTYAVYTIPNADSWEVMLYKDLTLGGNVNDYKKENELIRVKVPVTKSGNKTETFTIEFSNVMPTSMNLDFVWDNVRASVKITADIDTKVMKNIETAMSPADKRPYYSAASYFYENDKDLKQALEWITKATELNPKAYWVWHLKAKIELKMKNNAAAIASAEKSMALAKEDGDDTYVSNNQKLIAEAKK